MVIRYLLFVFFIAPCYAETTVYAYAEYEAFNTQFHCENEPLVANFGIRQSLYQKGNLTVAARLNHLSCIAERDKHEYNALGVGIEYKLFE